jgi:hypothetical protein
MQTAIHIAIQKFTREDLLTAEGHEKVESAVRSVTHDKFIYCPLTGTPLIFSAFGQDYKGELVAVFKPLPKGDPQITIQFITPYDDAR